MPWKQTNPESEQVRFIERWQAGEMSFVEVCRQFGISQERLQACEALSILRLGRTGRPESSAT